MLTAIQQEQATQQPTKKNYQPEYIFVLSTYDGRVVVGQGNNPAKRIAHINSGYNQALPALCIHSIIGVKEQTSDRTYVGVVNKMMSKYGEDKVIAV